MTEWFEDWFNEDYIALYSYRDGEEAKKQVEFLVQALLLNGDERVIDIGCGTGRHAHLLAKMGFDVVGIDTSPFMIAKAKEESSFPIAFHQTNLLDYQDSQGFDVGLSLFTSFGYYDTQERNQKVLDSIAKLLRTGGKYFLDYLHPYQVRKTLLPFEERVVMGKKVMIEKEIVNNQVIKTITFPHHVYQEKVLLYSREQIVEMLGMAGFSMIQCWSDYKGVPWSPQGERQLFFAQKI